VRNEVPGEYTAGGSQLRNDKLDDGASGEKGVWVMMEKARNNAERPAAKRRACSSGVNDAWLLDLEDLPDSLNRRCASPARWVLR
jgi:hypothetical protein